MIVGLLGVLKAGGVDLPLEPANPTARIAYMLSDANARVLLTQHELVERFLVGPQASTPAGLEFSELGLPIVCLEDKSAPADLSGQQSVPPGGSGWV